MLQKIKDRLRPAPAPNLEVEKRIASIAQSLNYEIVKVIAEYDGPEGDDWTELEEECLTQRLDLTNNCLEGIRSFADIGLALHIRTTAAERHYHSAFNKLPDDLKAKYRKLESMI